MLNLTQRNTSKKENGQRFSYLICASIILYSSCTIQKGTSSFSTKEFNIDGRNSSVPTYYIPLKKPVDSLLRQLH